MISIICIFLMKGSKKPFKGFKSLSSQTKSKSYLIQDVLNQTFTLDVSLQSRKNTGRTKKICHKLYETTKLYNFWKAYKRFVLSFLLHQHHGLPKSIYPCIKLLDWQSTFLQKCIYEVFSFISPRLLLKNCTSEYLMLLT